MNESEQRLRIALRIGVAILVIGIPSVWPIGYYTLVRLVVCAAAIYTIVVRRGIDSPHLVGLAFIVLLFNPLIPVELGKALWVVIDLGVAYYFWQLSSDAFGQVSAGGDSEGGSGQPPTTT